MATINDVAKLAGVSHGTVSKVLNHVSGVSAEKIKKVEDAVAALGYTPNNFATNLRNSGAQKTVAIVLPTLGDTAINGIYEGIARAASQKGFEINVYFTRDLISEEKRILQKIRGYNLGKVLLVTCQPQRSEYFQDLAKHGMNFVFIQRWVEGFDFVGVSIKNQVETYVRSRIRQGDKRIALISGPREYSFEAECIEGYMKALFFENFDIQRSYILTGSIDQESAMRNAVKLLNMQDPPDTILLTNDILLGGARKAVDLICGKDKDRPNIICFSGQQWWRVDYPYEQEIALPFGQVGVTAFELIRNKATKKGPVAPRTVRIQPEQHQRNIELIQVRQPTRIQVLLQSGTMMKTVEALLNNFKRRTNIDVEIEQKDVPDLQKEVFRNRETHCYDAFCIEQTWLHQLARTGDIECLEQYLQETDGLKGYSESVFRAFAEADGRIYALPFSYTMLMLFYRKDVFEDLRTQRQFFEIYRKPLRVPGTWDDYNRVARFFTKSYNSESATMYGTTIAGRATSGAFCEFLPRAWAMGSNLLRGEDLDLTDETCVRALKNYMECAMYAHPAAKDWWWPEAVHEFASGSTAMALIYSDRATDIVDRNMSNVVGKIGYSFVPGKTSLMGGRSIAMSAFSAHKSETIAFIQWTAEESSAMANAVLGRIIPRQSICDSDELANLYPWHKETFRAFDYIKKNEMPLMYQEKGILISDFLQILGRAVNDGISGRNTAEVVLHNAQLELKRKLEE